MQHIVGFIEGHDVIYVPERNMLFCKNTAISYPLIERIIVKDKNQRTYVEEKKLQVTKDNGVISLGCLTTTMSNCLKIRNNIKKIK